MGATAWLARRWLRRRWLTALSVAIVVAAGGACTMLALAASDRTANAYTDYVDRADVGDVVINPGFATREILDVLTDLPGVQRVTSSVLLTASLEEATPIRRPPPAVTDVVDETTVFVLGSSDGRYFETDRPAIQSGRMPTGASEAVVTQETSTAFDLRVGDVVPVSFWNFGLEYGLDESELEARADDILAPLGVEHLTIVGVVTLADEGLPEVLYPRQRMIVSPDITDRYDCLPREPPPGLTLAENVEILAPADCAVAQNYFSLEIADGADGVEAALDEYLRITGDRNVTLRANISDIADFEGQEPQYSLIPAETRLDIERVDDAVRPTVAALLVLGLVAAVLTVVLVGLAAWRELQRTTGDHRQWHQLGVATGGRAWVAALPMLAGIFVGAVVAVPGAWLLDLGPQGVVAAMEPEAARRLVPAAVLGIAAIVIATVVLTYGLAVLTARRVGRTMLVSDQRDAGRSLVLPYGGPVLTEGVRAASRRRSGVPVIGGLAVAVATLVAALTFGSSLSALVSNRTAFGWPWDLVAATNAGYGGLDIERAKQLLDDDPDIGAWTYYGFTSAVALDGAPISALIDPARGSATGVTVVEGRLPAAADEVAVGQTTASELDLDVGDPVELGGLVQPALPATVTAIVVLPTMGPFESDRVTAGSGMLVPFALFETPQLEWYRDFASSFYAFVAIDLADGVDEDAAIARLEPLIGALEISGIPALTYPQAVRPVEIADVDDTRSLPISFSLAFAAVAAIGLGVATWTATRSRRREIATLRSLGFDAGQVRAMVVVQSVAAVIAALAIGVPVGVLAGRASWRAFGTRLGVVPDPSTSTAVLAAVVVGGLVPAVLTALIPAHLATRGTPAEGLRSE